MAICKFDCNRLVQPKPPDNLLVNQKCGLLLSSIRLNPRTVVKKFHFIRVLHHHPGSQCDFLPELDVDGACDREETDNKRD